VPAKWLRRQQKRKKKENKIKETERKNSKFVLILFSGCFIFMPEIKLLRETALALI